jgi:Fe-S oxidoreductase/nitrate reductase gamma subunit
MNNLSGATRQLGLFSDLYPFMYAMLTVASIVCVLGILLRVWSWKRGRGRIGDRLDDPGARLVRAARDILSQVRVLRKRFPGALHLVIFWGFVIFFAGTVSLMLQEQFGFPVYTGSYYLFLNMIMDLFAGLGIIGIALALGRRVLGRERSLRTGFGDLAALFLVISILTTGLLLEAIRIASNGDPWAPWQPVGHMLSTAFSGFDSSALGELWSGMWVFHMLLSMVFIAALPYWKMFHTLTAFPALFFGDRDAARSLPPVDLEIEDVELGAGHINDLHWKYLLDADSCMACGRCEENCPAHMAGKSLSPLDINLGVRKDLRRGFRGSVYDNETNREKLVPETVSEDSLWACTTCRACETHCPVVVEHVPRLVEIRRNKVMMKGEFPNEALSAFKGMEDNYNPWNISWSTRNDWAAGLDVPVIKETGSTPLLLWTGCSGAFDKRNIKVVRSLVRILEKAGVEFATLGTEEKCCGDSARRLGHELLFQTLAADNVATLGHYGITRIITTCPHCFNSLSNEYMPFGGDYEVIHHTDFINSLIVEGRIAPAAEGRLDQKMWAYHDPCYLGRYNDIYEAPRKALGRSVEDEIRELPRTRTSSTCCGGGGGRMWLEEEKDKAVVNLRVDEIRAAGISAVATACPFCLTMLSDGLKEKEDAVVMDVAEVVASTLDQYTDKK